MNVYVKGAIGFVFLWVVLGCLSRVVWWLLLLAAGKFSWPWVVSAGAGFVFTIKLIDWMPDPAPTVISEGMVAPTEPTPPRTKISRIRRDVN